jgi:hypothetical protein
MAPVEIRSVFHDTIDAFRRAWAGTATERTIAHQIMAALRTHRWLQDQIPYDILDRCIALTATDTIDARDTDPDSHCLACERPSTVCVCP